MSHAELTHAEETLLFTADGQFAGAVDEYSRRRGRYAGNSFLLADIAGCPHGLKPIIERIIVGLQNGSGEQVQTLGVDPNSLIAKLTLLKK